MSSRNRSYVKNRSQKIKTNKIISRLTYCPNKHKQKFTKNLRHQLQQKVPPLPPSAKSPPTTLKFGSFNVNGLDLEASRAVDELLNQRGFDVRKPYTNISEKHKIKIKLLGAGPK